MYGKDCLETGEKSISGEIKFYGLEPTNMNLKNLNKHQRLIESYEKLQKAKETFIPLFEEQSLKLFDHCKKNDSLMIHKCRISSIQIEWF